MAVVQRRRTLLQKPAAEPGVAEARTTTGSQPPQPHGADEVPPEEEIKLEEAPTFSSDIRGDEVDFGP
eukprot:6354376-Amphidinium_carterae.1